MSAKPKRSGTASRRAETSAESEENEAVAALNAVPTIGVYGDFTKGMTAIPRSAMSVVVGTGRLQDGTKVLVPVVDVKLNGVSGEMDMDDELLLTATTTFENAAFLLADLAEDFLGVSRQVEWISRSDLRPEPVRTGQAIRFLQAAQRDIAATIERLHALVGSEGVSNDRE